MREFISELRKRHVFKVGFAYLVVAWLLLQVADTLLPIYEAPGWLLPAFTTILFLGFPVAILLAWAYDVHPASSASGLISTVHASSEPSRELAMPEGPSIAVLPFSNLISDPSTDNFARAITGDIATGLTQTSSLRVISGEISAKQSDTLGLAKELGVRYVLEGTVNRAGRKLRITAKLTDARDGSSVWSQKYDERLTADNLFDVQDDICSQIVAALGDFHGVIYSSETRKNIHRPTASLSAYECLSVALAYDKYLTEEYHLRARESLEQAVKIDPGFDAAWAHLSWIYTDEEIFGYNPLPGSMARALDAARRGVELAPSNYHNHWLLARVYYFSGNREQFFAEAEKALSLNSSDGTTLGLIGAYMTVSGQWDRGVALIRKAQLLNPRHPDYYFWFLGAAELHAGNIESALVELRRMTFVDWPMALLALTAVNALAGDEAEARRFATKIVELHPGAGMAFAKEHLERFLPYADDLVARIMDGLRQVLPAA